MNTTKTIPDTTETTPYAVRSNQTSGLEGWAAPARKFALWCLLAVLLPWTAQAQPAGTSFQAHFGSFNTSVPIKVPDFRGLEPKLQLVYAPTVTSSWLGVGWSLSGASVIERGISGGGSPTYDENLDTYFLDGMELLPCNSQGGTHCTRVQNYARIEYNPGADSWDVIGTNGNVATYEPIFQRPEGTFRWMLTSIEDAFGNRVNYDYWCDESKNCYLEEITYGSASIRFYCENRPDPMNFATGSDLGETRHRLRTVAVEVDGELARAYALRYEQSVGTHRSLIVEVQQYGRDASVDAFGEVSGGSALPAMTLGWRQPQPDIPDFPFDFEQTLPGASTATNSYLHSSYRNLKAGDWNGDGRTDLLHLHPDSNPQYSWTALSNGDGTFDFQRSLPGASEGTNSYLHTSYRNIYVGDWNGDGRSDLLHLHPDSRPQFSWVALANGDGTFDFQRSLPGASAGTNSHIDTSYRSILVGDWNGDGKSDLLHLHPSSDPKYSWVAISQGDGTFDFQRSLPGSHVNTNSHIYRNYQIHVGDWNGDGLSDLFYLHPHADPQYSWTALSNGDGTFDFQRRLPGSSVATNSYLGDGNGPPNIQVGDWNGDGKTDLFYLHPSSNPQYSWVALSRGDGSFDFNRSLPGASAATSSFLNSNRVIQVGDWNGDGLSDLLHLHSSSSTQNSWVAVSKGDGTFDFRKALPSTSTGNSSYLGTNAYIAVGDWDGDGTSDLAYLHPDSRAQYSWTALSRHRIPDLVTSLENGLGGRTTLDYTPSTSWRNTYLPHGLTLPTLEAITVEDGRGSSSTTAFHYEGGLWSNEERRFLGFRRVTQVVDAQGTYSETFYLQRIGSLSKPEFTYLKNADGQIYNYSAYSYSENASPPYTSLLTEKWDYECNQTNNCRRALTQFAYDVYSNVIGTFEHGDYDRLGDERTVRRGYVPNLDRYITGLPSYEALYEGIGSGGPVARHTLYRYDGNDSHQEPPRIGRLSTSLEWDNQAGTYHPTRYEYDFWGNLTRVTDPRGSFSVTRWDDNEHLYPVQVCNALAHCTQQSWDPVLGLRRTETDPNGSTTAWDYDAFGRRVTTTFSDGSVARTKYLDWGNPNRQRIWSSQPDGTADGLWSEQYQDGLGRIWLTVSEDGARQDTVFVDTSDRVWKKSLPRFAGEPAQWIFYSYDGAGRVLTVSNPDGSYAETVYAMDIEGMPVVAIYDEMNRETLRWHDAYGRLTQVRESEGLDLHYTTHSYNALDKLIQTVDALGNIATVTWDSMGRKVAMYDWDAGLRTFSYDPGGLLRSQTDARQRTLHYTYDLLGRPKSKTSADGTTEWFYDTPGYGASIGRLTRVTAPGNSQAHIWDARGREISSTRCVRGDCQTLARQFDALGRVTHLTYPDQETLFYRYADSGRLASIAGYLITIEWNAAGQPTRLAYGNGTETSYTYSPTRRWLESSEVTSYGNLIYQSEYSYDTVGSVTFMQTGQIRLPNLADVIFRDGFESGDTRAWSSGRSAPGAVARSDPWFEHRRFLDYDDLGRLVGINGDEDGAFAYDALGNMTSSSRLGQFAYDPQGRAHAPIRIGNRSLTYDAGGNLVADGRRSMTWNAENRLSSVSAMGHLSQFLYDANGVRVEKRSDEGITVFFTNELERINGRLVKYIFAGPMLIARKDAEGPKWFHSDHLGSTRLLTDSKGQPERTYRYDAFGKLLEDSGGPANSRTFSGHVGDSESGLIYMGARYYDPELCRFVSPDTVVPDATDPQALNRYAYALNNPVSNLDPTGHAPVVAAVASVAGVIAAEASTWVIATAVIGASMSVAGYYTGDPVLSTIGGILLGFSGGYAIGGGTDLAGGLLGAGVSAATSPLSPLDGRAKQVLGWAYSAYGVFKGWSRAQAKIDSHANPAAQEAVQRILNGDGTVEDIRFLEDTFQVELPKTIDKLQERFRSLRAATGDVGAGISQAVAKEGGKNFAGSPAHIWASEVLASRVGEINIVEAMLLDPTNGIVGPTGSNWNFLGPVIGTHGIQHDANGLSYELLKGLGASNLGRGYASCPMTCGFFPASKYSGQVFGISRQLLTYYHGYYPVH